VLESFRASGSIDLGKRIGRATLTYPTDSNLTGRTLDNSASSIFGKRRGRWKERGDLRGQSVNLAEIVGRLESPVRARGQR
jgi:hypothetical protein